MPDNPDSDPSPSPAQDLPPPELAAWKIRLRRLREERGLSRKQLASMIGLPNDDRLYRWEEIPTATPDPEQLLQVADALKVSVHDLVDVAPPVIRTGTVAETGSGKTYQFLLSALDRLLASKGRPTTVEISVEGGGRIIASGIQGWDDPPEGTTHAA